MLDAPLSHYRCYGKRLALLWRLLFEREERGRERERALSEAWIAVHITAVVTLSPA